MLQSQIKVESNGDKASNQSGYNHAGISAGLLIEINNLSWFHEMNEAVDKN